MKRLFIVCFACVFLLSGCSVFSPKEKKSDVVMPEAPEKKEVPISETRQNTIKKSEPVPVVENTKKIKKADLYEDNNQLFLSTIAGISNLNSNVKALVNHYVENSIVYYLEEKDGKVFMIVSNSNEEKFQRHGVELVEVSQDGTKKVTPLIKTSDGNGNNDEWEFDEITKLPIKHIHYNSEGDVEYLEAWNYSADNPIKYELKNKEDKVLSLKKEIQDNDTNLRVEHLVYDENGSISLNISANYEGADITRLTYFDSRYPDKGFIVMSQLEDGQKVKETVYSSDYRVKNVYEPFYENGNLSKIKVFDNEHKELEEILSE